jgi:hypothetical protein
MPDKTSVLSQQIRDQFLVEDLNVRETGKESIEIGYHEDDEWTPYVRLKQYADTVAVETWDRDRDQWDDVAQPVDEASLRVLVAWIEERLSDE